MSELSESKRKNRETKERWGTMDLSEIIEQSLKNNPGVVVNMEDENPFFKERIQEFVDALSKIKDETKPEGGTSE